MKCPVCDFITNPQKDLCSRCFSDLRAAKAELGLKIIQPDLPYEQLLASKVKIVQKTKSPEPKKLRKFAFILKLAASLKKKRSTDMAEIEPGSELLEVDKIADLEIAPKVDSNPDRSEEPSGLRLTKRQREQMLGLLRRRQQKQESRKSSIIASAMPHQLQMSELHELDSELERLFTECMDQIGEASTFSPSAGVAGSELIKLASDNSLKALFELVAGDLVSPERLRKFVDPREFKKINDLESDSLKQAVRDYQEEDIDYQRKQALGGIQFDPYIEGQAATIAMRIKAWSLDFIGCLFVAIILAIITQLFTGQLLASALLGEMDFYISDLLSLLIKALTYFIILKYLFLPIVRVWTGNTFGERHCNLRLVNQDHALPGIFLSFLWNLAEVLVLVSFGIFECSKSSIFAKEKICSAKILRS